MTGPKWLDIARGELGQKEVPGAGDNPRIVQYMTESGLGAFTGSGDETPWCRAFAQWAFARADVPVPTAPNALAKGFLDWGYSLLTPLLGCVAVLNRASDPNGLTMFGHVGFVTARTTERIRIIGGNQGDKVSEDWFDMKRVARFGFRWPFGVPVLQEYWLAKTIAAAQPAPSDR